MSKRKRSLFVFPRLLFEFSEEMGTLPKLDVALEMRCENSKFCFPFDFSQRDVSIQLKSDRLGRFQTFFDSQKASLRQLIVWRQFYNVSERLAILTTQSNAPSGVDPSIMTFYHERTDALHLDLQESLGEWTLTMHIKESLLQSLYSHTIFMIQKCNSRHGQMLYSMYEYEGDDQWTQLSKVSDESNGMRAPKKQKLHVLPSAIQEQQESIVTVTGQEPAVRRLFACLYKTAIDEHMASHCMGNDSYMLPFSTNRESNLAKLAANPTTNPLFDLADVATRTQVNSWFYC